MENEWNKLHILHKLVWALTPSVILFQILLLLLLLGNISPHLRMPKVSGRYKQQLGQNALHPARKCLIFLKLKDSLRNKKIENIMSRYFNTKCGIMFLLWCYSHGTEPILSFIPMIWQYYVKHFLCVFLSQSLGYNLIYIIINQVIIGIHLIWK